MDEFSAYQPLGCHAYPLSERYHLYREACHLYDLRLPFTDRFLPLRSYRYIGSLPVAVYYPFWKLVRRPVSARLQGAVFFLIALFLTRRVTGAGWTATVVASLAFPVYFFAFLSDAGPAGLSLILLLLALLGIRGAREERSARRRLVAAAGAGLFVFLGIFVKPVFLWTAPALALAWFVPWFPSSGPGEREPFGLRPRLAALIVFGTTALVPGLLLAAAIDRFGARYAEVASVGRAQVNLAAMGGVARRLGRYFLNGAAILPRTLEIPFAVVDLVPAATAATLIAATIAMAPGARRAMLGALAMAASAFAVMLVVERAWAPHHVVFSMVFVVLALARALEALGSRRRAWLGGTGVAVALYAGLLLARLPAAAQHPGSSAAKDELLRFIRTQGLDGRTVQVHIAWGTYYIAHLFGREDQAVVYLDRFSFDKAERPLRRAARELGRTLLVVGSDLDVGGLEPAQIARFGTLRSEYRYESWWAREYAP